MLIQLIAFLLLQFHTLIFPRMGFMSAAPAKTPAEVVALIEFDRKIEESLLIMTDPEKNETAIRELAHDYCDAVEGLEKAILEVTSTSKHWWLRSKEKTILRKIAALPEYQGLLKSRDFYIVGGACDK